MYLRHLLVHFMIPLLLALFVVACGTDNTSLEDTHYHEIKHQTEKTIIEYEGDGGRFEPLADAELQVELGRENREPTIEVSNMKEGKKESLPALNTGWLQSQTSFLGTSFLETKAFVEDSEGNLFICGTFSGRIKLGASTMTSTKSQEVFLLKLDPRKEVLWAVHFQGGSSSDKLSLAVDKAGSVFLSRSFSKQFSIGSKVFKPNAGLSTVLMKFGSSGKLQWSKSIADKFLVSNLDLKISEAGLFLTGKLQGSGIVAGHSMDTKSQSHIYITHLDLKGNIRWFRSFPSHYAIGESIALGNQGQVGLCGSFQEKLTLGEKIYHAKSSEFSAFIAMFDKDGTPRKMTHVVSSSASSLNLKCAFSEQGKLFLSGRFSNRLEIGGRVLRANKDKSSFLALLDENLKVGWSQLYIAESSLFSTMVAAESGGIYISGYTRGFMSFGNLELHGSYYAPNIFVMKVLENGNRYWLKSFPIASASVGNVVSGAKDGRLTLVSQYRRGTTLSGMKSLPSIGGGTSLLVLELNDKGVGNNCKSNADCPLGTHCERNICTHAPKNCHPQPKVCAIHPVSSNVCHFENGYTFEKLPDRCDGTCRWNVCKASCSTKSDCAAGHNCSAGQCLRVEQDVVHVSPSKVLHHPSIVKLRQHGRFRYIIGVFARKVQIGSKTSTMDGSQKGTYVAKLNLSGEVQWLTSFAGEPSDVIIDAKERVVVTGSFRKETKIGPTTHQTRYQNGLFVARFLPTGAYDWSFSVEGSSHLEAAGLVVLQQGEIIVAGSYQSTVRIEGTSYYSQWSSKDSFLLKLSKDGKFRTLQSYTCTQKDQVTSIVADGSSGFYVAGVYSGTLVTKKGKLSAQKETGGLDGYLLRYDDKGNELWSKSLGPVTVTTIVLNQQKELFLGGYFQGSHKIDGKLLTSVGKNDLFVRKLSSDGNVQWMKTMGTKENDTNIVLYPWNMDGVFAGFQLKTSALLGASLLSSKGHPFLGMMSFDKDGKVTFLQSTARVDQELSPVSLWSDRGVLSVAMRHGEIMSIQIK